MTTALRLLNVGGNSKKIAIPRWYQAYEHLILDIDAAAKPDIVCDARNLMSLSQAQFDAIYCSHNLEHYFAHDVGRVLKGFLHVLKPSGFAEIRVPDLDLVMKTYVEKKMDVGDVLYESNAGPITVRDVIYGFGREIERSGVDFYAHKTGFTRKSLMTALKRAGFQGIYAGGGRQYEILAFAFPQQPTEALLGLLGLKPAPGVQGRD
jgi:SAM-dependent methyltransferase